MLVDHITSGICNLRIGDVILIRENTTLLDYGHLSMGSLYAMASKSRTWVLSHCHLHKVFDHNQFFVVEYWINSKIGFWGS